MNTIDPIKSAKRIAIIGNAGSGKSTLAQKLHEILGLPLYHLDQYFWGSNWQHPDLEEYEMVHMNLCDQESWIIDGMNLRFLMYRIIEADVVILLDMPRYICFWRIFKRVITYYGEQAPHSAPGCHEKIDLKFFQFLKWVWNFRKRRLDIIIKMMEDFKDTKTIYVLKTSEEVERFIQGLIYE